MTASYLFLTKGESKFHVLVVSVYFTSLFLFDSSEACLSYLRLGSDDL